MARPFRVATYNLESLDDAPGHGPPFEARAAALRPILAALDADVLCLQEVHGQKEQKHGPRSLRALDRLLEGTAYAHFERVSTTRADGGPSDRHNLVIASRHPIRAHRQLKHDLVPPVRHHVVTAEPAAEGSFAVEWDRPILHAEIDVFGAPVHLLDLHLRAPLASAIAGQKQGPETWRTIRGWAEGFFLAAIKRTGQALEARLLVDALFDDDPRARIIVAGDLNADEHETPVRVLRGDPGDTGNASLGPRVLVPLERAVDPEARFSIVHAGARHCLDHVLVSPVLVACARGVEIVNEGLPDEAGGVATAASFHAPIVATFEL